MLIDWLKLPCLFVYRQTFVSISQTSPKGKSIILPIYGNCNSYALTGHFSPGLIVLLPVPVPNSKIAKLQDNSVRIPKFGCK